LVNKHSKQGTNKNYVKQDTANEITNSQIANKQKVQLSQDSKLL